MAKEKKYVKVESKKSESNEVYGKDSHGRIIKVEPKGEPKKRATCKRVLAIICWIIAIAFEVIGILRLTEILNWFSSLEPLWFLIICLALDLIFVVIGSQLWKKANHIDPASEKNKIKFWLWNNLGTVVSIVAFLPLIISIFKDDKLDKKSKGILGGVAIAALAIAGLTSYDWNPVSMEWLERAEQEVLQVSPSGTVYWAEHSKKYHVDPDCPAFSNSEVVYEWTVADAYERWLTDPCRRCIPELEDEEWHTHEDVDSIEEWQEENELWNLLWEALEE